MTSYVLLAGAIVSEVVATLALKASDGFSRLGYAVLVVLGYGVSFTFLAMALKRGLPVGAGYAIWSAVGTTAVAALGVVLFHERLSAVGVLGIGLIVLGVVLLQLGQAG